MRLSKGQRRWFCGALACVALAALAALERPRASMIAAPRFWTVGMKVFLSHSSSLMTSVAGLPQIFAL